MKLKGLLESHKEALLESSKSSSKFLIDGLMKAIEIEFLKDIEKYMSKSSKEYSRIIQNAQYFKELVTNRMSDDDYSVRFLKAQLSKCTALLSDQIKEFRRPLKSIRKRIKDIELE